MFDIPPDIAKSLTRFAAAFVPMLLGMVCHEVAHGYAAYRLGDPTAKLAGRLSANPISHLDATGTLLFALTAMFTPFVLGWAKPVPVQPRYFKDPRKGMMLVSFAGPATNFFLALVFGGLFAILAKGVLSESVAFTPTVKFLFHAIYMGIWVNLILAWFNLLPIPTLDGGHILAGVLPLPLAQKFYAFGKYWIIILIALMATGVLWRVIRPLLDMSLGVIASLYSIPPRLLLL